MITHYNINGKPTPVEQAVLHVSDLSILRGFGIFDYFLAREGHPLFLEDYLNRFYRSAEITGLEIPFSKTELTKHIYNLLEINQKKDAGIRLVLTGGYSPDGYTPADPNLLILMYDLPANAWEFSQTGLKIITHRFQRELPEVKTINYATGIRMLGAIKAAGAQDLLYVDGDWVRESARSNFFIVTPEGKIATTPDLILSGVTRKQVLEIARKNNFTVEERPVHIAEIETAAEAFFTSSTKGVMPITWVDGQPVGDGKPGPVSVRLQTLFLEHVRQYLNGKNFKS
jgi:branched-chain amino acid aminotransferase